MTAASDGCHGKTTRLWRTNSRRRVSRHSSKIEDAPHIAQISKVKMFRHLDASPTTQVAEIMVKHWRSSGSPWTKFVRSPTCGTLVMETVWGSSVGTWMGKSTELEVSICSSKTRIILVGRRGCKMAAKKQNMAPMWKKVMELVDLDEPTSFLGHEKIWDALNVNVNRTKLLLSTK